MSHISLYSRKTPIVLYLTVLIVSAIFATNSGESNNIKNKAVVVPGSGTISKQSDSLKQKPLSSSDQKQTKNSAAKLSEPREISAEQLKNYLDRKTQFFLIDGRGVDFYQETIIGAVLIMEQELEAKRSLLPPDKKTRIVAFCAGNGCEASKRICQKLMEYGYTKTEYYFGGFPDWKAKGYPTEVPGQ